MLASAVTRAISSSSRCRPSGTMSPNSLARPRIALASIVCCLTRSDLAACSASTACCATLLIGTNWISGREPATHRAAASTASFFLPFLTKGFTASGAISFTSWPKAVSKRAQ